LNLDKLSLIVSVPNYEINTEEAGEVVPNAYYRDEAVARNALANELILAVQNQAYKLMAEVMMTDAFHEPYRQPLISEVEALKETALKNGALATVISGAGPTVLTLCEVEHIDKVLDKLKAIDSCQHKIVNVYSNR